MSDTTWMFWSPNVVTLPEQGWKLHVSALATCAESALAVTADFCEQRGWPFKHLVDDVTLRRTNEKDANRVGSGKFVTLYPPSGTPELADVEQLAHDLRAVRGPRVLSDLRWRDSVVSLRYGAFAARHTWDGEPAMLGPEGVLEPDRRGVAFEVPTWVAVPGWIEEERRRQMDLGGGALAEFEVDGAYGFSNSGGVYRAAHAAFGRVVLKEGREHVAVRDGHDAADRVEREYAFLRDHRVDGVTPRAFSAFRSGGSAFVTLEPAPGVPFNRAVMARNPLVTASPTSEQLEVHAQTVRDVIAALRDELLLLHESGIVHGDIAPRNVLVQGDGSIRLIDFETAQTIDSRGAPSVGTPGFTAPRAVSGVDRDLFSLACLHLAALLPLTELIPLDRTKVHQLCDEAQRRFPTAAVAEIRSTLEQILPGSVSADNDRVRTQLSVAGLQSAIEQRRCTLATARESGPTGPGLAVSDAPGTSSTAIGGSGTPVFESVLASGGLAEQDVGALCREAAITDRVGLRDGLAGLGLFLVPFRRDQTVRDALDRLAARLVAVADRGVASALRPGLLQGPSGLSLFLSVYGRGVDDPELVTAARRLLDVDLARLEATPEAGTQLRAGARMLPFLGEGSAGVGIALLHLPPTEIGAAERATLSGIRKAASTVFTARPGMSEGRAGLVHFLVDHGEATQDAAERAAVRAALELHRDAFPLHMVTTPTGLAVCDPVTAETDDSYAYGSAGVLSAISAIDAHLSGSDASSSLPSFLRGGPR